MPRDLRIIGVSDLLTDLIVVTTNQFAVREANKAAKAVLGKGESIIGSHCFALFHDRTEACLDCPLEVAMASGGVKTIHYFDKRFGEFFEERIQPILNEDDSLGGVIITNRNVTEVRENEERSSHMKKLAAIGKLSSGAAHDFNNVIAGVLGRVHLMRKSAQGPDLIKHLDSIEDAVHTGSETVRRMLEYAKGENSRTMDSLDFHNLMDNVLFITQHKWAGLPEEKGIVIKLITEFEDDLYLKGNKSELINAFTNLIVNAVDAMPDGGVLKLIAKRSDDHIMVIVKDTGTGMTPDIIDRIFDPFFSTKGKNGTGLGLSEVYGTIRRHGAKIEVDSSIGRGTQFTLKFQALNHVKKTGNDPSIGSARYNILALDDEEYLLETLKDVLEEEGHKVTCFSAANEALKSVRENHNYDLIITDYEMANIDGREFSHLVKGLSISTPIILLSGWPISLDEDMDLAGVVDGVLTKPFSIEDLHTAFHSVLGSADPGQLSN
ncbi:MAG: response regulator [Candidatus Marinimicrobia bacterium]|nr:response regulator [Candidatus Neomarinimicrobiota bacterium]